MAVIKRFGVGFAGSSDAGLAAQPRKILVVGIGSSTEVPLSLSGTQTIEVGFGLVGEVAFPVVAEKRKATGIPATLDGPQAATCRKTFSVGLAMGPGTALSSVVLKRLLVGLVGSTSVSFSAERRKTYSLGLVSEADLALVLVTGAVSVAVGQAQAVEGALGVNVLRARRWRVRKSFGSSRAVSGRGRGQAYSTGIFKTGRST